MNDRDTFAAAALTGLIANGDYSVESTPVLAWRMADAMLREREKREPVAFRDGVPVYSTNHDAVPAATASVESVVPQPTTHGDSDRTDKAAPRPSEGTGNTPMPKEKLAHVSDREPVAWATFYPNGSTASVYVVRQPPHAEPLYRYPRPTLTDEEREAVDTAEASLIRESTDLNTPPPVRQRLGAAAATLRGLLERLA